MNTAERSIADLDIESIQMVDVEWAYNRISVILRKAEWQTSAWVKHNLRTSKGLIIVHSYRLPMKAALRTFYRKFYESVYREGGRTITIQIHETVNMTRSSSRIRAKADLACDLMVSRIENDLKASWAREMNNTIDVNRLLLFTKKVFNDTIGL